MISEEVKSSTAGLEPFTLILWYKLYSFFKTVPRSRSHSFYGTSYAHSLRLYLGVVSHSFYGTSYTHSLRLYLGAVHTHFMVQVILIL